MKKKIPAMRQKTYHCGKQNKKAEYIEVDIFPYTELPEKRKKRRTKEYLTTPKRKEINDKNARRYFSLLVKSNFTDGDYCVTLTYAPESKPRNLEEAETKHMRNYLCRLRNLYKKHGEELKYTYVTETGKRGTNIHHHILLKNSGVSRDEIESCWTKKGLGFANAKKIRKDEKGIERLAGYLQKETAGKKRWKSSKNLIKPWVSISDDNISKKKVDKLAQLPTDCEAVREFWEKRFPQYILYEIQHYFNTVTARWSIYIKMRLRR